MSLSLLSVPQISLSPFVSKSCSFSPMVVTAIPVSRLQFKPIDLHPESNSNAIGFRNRKRVATIVNASSSSSDTDGTAPSESKEEAVTVDKLPLESKLQERNEQKLKMKLAKKIRLRRKRLVRKRRLRKKGRWPPSKMKKLKNV